MPRRHRIQFPSTDANDLAQDEVAFNETFLDKTDESGFSRLIRELIFSEYLDMYHLEKYRRRLSMEGTPLYYFALVVQKTANIPVDFLVDRGISTSP